MSDTPTPPSVDDGGSGNETTFGSIEPIEIQEEMERSFLEYSMSVIISRALPDVRDGLKPVHRRILWDMETQNFRPDRPFVKCARVSGDCFVEGALVRTPEGLKPIEQFVEGDVVLDALGKPTTVVAVIENPASEITQVEFEAGWSIDVTDGQLFRVLNDDYSLGWVRADKVDGQRVLMAEAAPEPANIDALADRKAYVAGLLVAEGWLHSRGKPTSRTVAIGMTDSDPLSMVAEYLRATGITAGLSKRVKEGTEDLDVIRFTADDDLLEAVATTSAGKQVPRFVLADRSLFGHFIAGFLDGDGHIRTDGTRAIAFVSTSAMLLRQLRSMLADLGVAASLYRKPTQAAWADCWHLMVSGSAATMLAQALGGYLAIPRKADQLAHLAEFDGRTLRHAADSFPAAAVYEEVTRLHRGGGWFEALDGTKFRQALRTGGNRNAKVRFSVDRSTGLLTRQNLLEGGVLSLLHAAGSPLADRIRHALRFKTLRVREVRQAVRIAPTYDIQVDSDEHEIVVEGLVVHNCVAKFHPHGDGAVYDALVRMAQPFSLRHPLIDFHGNFGSPDFGPAASRYTECRLSPLAMQLLDSIDENTVDMVPNYDGSIEEPKVLPARFPNLLVNGSQGIAVGMATNIPPHNLGEVIDATLHLIDNPDATPDDLMQFVKGPDFPTGGYILGRVGITDAYRTGRGSVKMRAVAEIEETAKGGLQIVVRELPYQTSVNSIASRIKQLADSKDLDGIRDINDESAGIDTRLVISLKRDANANVILNNLYKLTPMQTSFGVNIVALVDGVPRQLNLRDCLHHYVVHQIEVITRRSQFRRDKAASRAHIVEGLVKALNVIDQVIALIRASEDREGARQGLMATFGFSDEQAEHILSMQLSRLTRLARIDLDAELTELQSTIAALDLILADEGIKRSVIKEELVAIRDKYATPRLAKLTHDPGDMSTEDLIDDKELVVTMTEAGYIKTVEASVFRTQSRGGRGKSGGSLKQDDLVRHIVYTSAHAYLLCFSNRGKVYRMKAHEVPERDRTAKGIPIVNLLPLQPGEKIQTIIDTRSYDGEQFLFFTTRKGTVKKTDFTAYDSSRRDGLIAINLHDGDELVKVIVTSGADDVFMVSLRGMTIRFNEDDVRSMGRTAAGVRGMKLRSGDEVVSCDVAKDDTAILMVTENGYGKRTEVERFTRQGRGGQGVIGIKLTGKKGQVVAAFMVGPDDEIIGISSGGTTMRTPVRDISSQGRDATGVRIMNLDAGQVVASVAPILADDEEDVE